MIKVDLITGFLGAGKTTFIRKYAGYLLEQGLKIGILENDYGAVNVDMMLLGDLRGEKCELEMIAGGCDYDCHKRRFKTKLISMAMMGYDRIIVEPSGIYDVDEFFDVLYDEPLDNWYQIGNVITILDAGLEEHMTKESDYLLACQVAKAGKLILSHTDEVTKKELLNTIQHVNLALETNKANKRFEAEIDETGNILMNPKVFYKNWDDFTKEDWNEVVNCSYQNTDHVKMHVTEDNNYTSLYYMNVRMPLPQLEKIVKKLLDDKTFGNVFRIKGFMMTENDQWIEINANQKTISLKPVSIGQEVIIVIGEGLSEEKINEKVWGHLL